MLRLIAQRDCGRAFLVRDLLEAVRPGVLVAGDVRAGAANRVAGAVGDGAMATRFVHAVLDG